MIKEEQNKEDQNKEDQNKTIGDKKSQVEYVIKAFREMGGTEEELIEERDRLENDEEHLKEWVLTIECREEHIREEREKRESKKDS